MNRAVSIAWGVLLGTVLGAAHATLIVVPQAKPPPAAVARDDARREAPEPRPAAAPLAAPPKARAPTAAEARCSEALATLSLGIDDAAARERLKSPDCQ